MYLCTSVLSVLSVLWPLGGNGRHRKWLPSDATTRKNGGKGKYNTVGDDDDFASTRQ